MRRWNRLKFLPASTPQTRLVHAGIGEVFLPLQLPSFAAGARQFPDRSDLDATHTGGRHLRGDLDGVVQVGGVNQIEPCQALRVGARCTHNLPTVEGLPA